MPFFEQSEILSDVGCSVIGINPGKSSKSERSYFVSNGCSYQATLDYWIDHEAKRHLYYNRLRDLVSAVFGGNPSILWTELVKCESADGTGEPPLQTFRTCFNQFLRKEIDAVPKTWPIFSVGKRSFERLSCFIGMRYYGLELCCNTRTWPAPNLSLFCPHWLILARLWL